MTKTQVLFASAALLTAAPTASITFQADLYACKRP